MVWRTFVPLRCKRGFSFWFYNKWHKDCVEVILIDQFLRLSQSYRNPLVKQGLLISGLHQRGICLIWVGELPVAPALHQFPPWNIFIRQQFVEGGRADLLDPGCCEFKKGKDRANFTIGQELCGYHLPCNWVRMFLQGRHVFLHPEPAGSRGRAEAVITPGALPKISLAFPGQFCCRLYGLL